MIATATAAPRPIPGPESLTPEWHESRRKRIGSSDAAKAVGLSEWGTPRDLYEEKTGGKAPFAGNHHTRRGRRYEPLIAEDWQEITGKTLAIYPAPLFIHPEHEWMSATPDGIISDDEGLEIKCPTWRQAYKFGEEGTDYLPQDYVVQAQHQMAVMGWSRVHFAVLFDISEEPRQYLVPRNDLMIERMIAAEKLLWDRIQNGDPPEPDWEHPRTPELIKALYGVDSGKSVILPAAIADLWNDQKKVHEEIKAAEAKREVLRAQVAYAMGDAAVALFESGPDGPIDLQLSRKKIDRRGYEVKATSYITLSEKKGKS